MNIEQLPSNIYYFWVLPEQDVREELTECVNKFDHRVTFLVSWDTYLAIRMAFSVDINDRDYPDWNVLDMFVLKVDGKPVNIMLTR